MELNVYQLIKDRTTELPEPQLKATIY